MQNVVADTVFYRIMACKTAKEAWHRLKEEYQGSNKTRQMQVLNLKREFESLNMQEDETISKYDDRISLIVNNIRLLGEEFTEKQIVEKNLVTLPERFESKISSLEESKDLSKLSLAQVEADDDAHEEQLFAVSYFSITESFDSWLLDSGCTHNLFNNVELFKFLDDTYKSKVKVGNGEAVEVNGRGTVSISTISGIKTISNVLYIPDMRQILLSVGQMLENNYSLHFKNRECVASDPSGVELFYVKMSNRMFSVDWEKIIE
ncbi:uncharacterized protein [Solanum lycopersicum]|uniref:uncharacterized protein n=1 Tax=Solanum lycopersicum TaxID=4081 RepID=UPI003748327B